MSHLAHKALQEYTFVKVAVCILLERRDLLSGNVGTNFAASVFLPYVRQPYQRKHHRKLGRWQLSHHLSR
jgi:hypothetical protein